MLHFRTDSESIHKVITINIIRSPVLSIKRVCNFHILLLVWLLSSILFHYLYIEGDLLLPNFLLIITYHHTNMRILFHYLDMDNKLNWFNEKFVLQMLTRLYLNKIKKKRTKQNFIKANWSVVKSL